MAEVANTVKQASQATAVCGSIACVAWTGQSSGYSPLAKHCERWGSAFGTRGVLLLTIDTDLIGTDHAYACRDQGIRLQDCHELCILPLDMPHELLRTHRCVMQLSTLLCTRSADLPCSFACQTRDLGKGQTSLFKAQVRHGLSVHTICVPYTGLTTTYSDAVCAQALGIVKYAVPGKQPKPNSISVTINHAHQQHFRTA